MTNNKHVSKRCGNTYRYHSRSDSHSKAISRLVLVDLLDACPLLLEHGKAGKVAAPQALPQPLFYCTGGPARHNGLLPSCTRRAPGENENFTGLLSQSHPDILSACGGNAVLSGG
jgi:hypothetical protein